MSKTRQVLLISVAIILISLIAAWIAGRGEAPPPSVTIPTPTVEQARALPPPVEAKPLTAAPKPPPRPADLGLAWLAKAQAEDGSWDELPGRTGLALLAFLSAGETHKHGRYKKTVKYGLRFLKQIQHPDGIFAKLGDARAPLDHAIATTAMVEAYGTTASPLFKQSAQLAIEGLQTLKDLIGSDAAWACLALDVGRAAGLRVDPARIPPLATWYDPDSKTCTPAEHAMGLFCIVADEKPFRDHPAFLAGLPHFAAASRSCTDPRYLYFGGRLERILRRLESWNRDVAGTVSARQREDGSFDATGPAAEALGRTGTTSLMTAAEAMTRWSRSHRIR
jgi:hypothetical protein